MSAYHDLSSLKFTTQTCREKKQRGEKISCLTAYDYAFARLFDESGIDILLAGDSLGMVAAGEESTLPVSMEQMIAATRAVRRGARRALVVADMPFGSYQVSSERAIGNAVRLIKAGAEAVKLEGGASRAALVSRLVGEEIPVMAHIGLTPQALHRMGGYRVQGQSDAAARGLLRDARALEEAGAFAVVLEGMPREVAAQITAAAAIPTIGIGAGPECDGQVLVMHDLLGLVFRDAPKFVRRYADLGEAARQAAEAFRQDVETGEFPRDQESYHFPVAATLGSRKG
ncbi:MAG: 3-methyl-2-oxobutanoate hydroxymethyltransferase [Terriglobales bacterium]